MTLYEFTVESPLSISKRWLDHVPVIGEELSHEKLPTRVIAVDPEGPSIELVLAA